MDKDVLDWQADDIANDIAEDEADEIEEAAKAPEVSGGWANENRWGVVMMVLFPLATTSSRTIKPPLGLTRLPDSSLASNGDLLGWRQTPIGFRGENCPASAREGSCSRLCCVGARSWC